MNPIGDQLLELGGQVYTMRPSFRAAHQIEMQIGDSLFAIAMRAGSKLSGLRASDVSAILYGGVFGGLAKGEQMPFTREEFDELVWKAGISNMMPLAGKFFEQILKGNPDEKKSEVTAK